MLEPPGAGVRFGPVPVPLVGTEAGRPAAPVLEVGPRSAPGGCDTTDWPMPMGLSVHSAVWALVTSVSQLDPLVQRTVLVPRDSLPKPLYFSALPNPRDHPVLTYAENPGGSEFESWRS